MFDFCQPPPFCHTHTHAHSLSRFVEVRLARKCASFAQKCGGTVGYCNNASLLLPSPLGLLTTVQYPLPSSPLRSHFAVLQLRISDRAAGRHCGIAAAYRVLTRLFPPWPGSLPSSLPAPGQIVFCICNGLIPTRAKLSFSPSASLPFSI